MKFIKSFGALTLLTLSVNANAAIINIDSTVYPNNQDVFLTAGDYVINAIGIADGGLYNAWNAWSATGAVGTCDVNGANCQGGGLGGYIHQYSFQTAELGTINVGDSSLPGRFETDLLALANADIFNFTLTSDATVSLYLADSGVADNIGGVSLELTEVSAVPVPAAAWLFGSGLVGLIGVARRKTT